MSQLVGDRKEGLLFVVSAPAGTGKTTLVKMLMDEFPTVIASISYTTRSPRKGEVNGKDYFFVTEAEFEVKINEQDFLEYVKLYGTYYGTSKQWVNDRRKEGKHVILVIDTQGAIGLCPEIKVTKIFIAPPSLAVLRSRLTHRGTESSDVIEQRLNWAEKELERSTLYDYKIINDELTSAYQILRSILIAECHRTEQGEKSGS